MRCDHGPELRVLCKYFDAARPQTGHRRGVAHEAMVYRRILPQLRVRVPAFHGVAHSIDGCGDCLVLEYIDDAVRLGAAPEQRALPLAAQWLGRFHAAAEPLTSAVDGELPTYASDFYLQWSRRTLQSHATHAKAWLVELCDNYERVVSLLLSSAQTIVHGEFYPKNILIRGEAVCAVDWESAAIAAGEIDLACLLDMWSGPILDLCAIEYGRSRWPGGSPSGFPQTLRVAKLHWNLRWLGDDSASMNADLIQQRLHRLYALGVELNLID